MNRFGKKMGIAPAVLGGSLAMMAAITAQGGTIPANAIYADSFTTSNHNSNLKTTDSVEIAPTATKWLFGGGSSNYAAVTTGTNTARNSGASTGVLTRAQTTTAASGNNVDVAAYTLVPASLGSYTIAVDVLVPTGLPTTKLDGWNDVFWGIDIMEYSASSTNYYSGSFHNIRIGLSHQNVNNGSYTLVWQQQGGNSGSIVLAENDGYSFSSTDWNQVEIQVDAAGNSYTVFLNGVFVKSFTPTYAITPYYAGVESVTNLKTDGSFSTSLDNFYIAPVPEPASLGWMACGGLLMGWRKMNRTR